VKNSTLDSFRYLIIVDDSKFAPVGDDAYYINDPVKYHLVLYAFDEVVLSLRDSVELLQVKPLDGSIIFFIFSQKT
jgi:hypothetical protein